MKLIIEGHSIRNGYAAVSRTYSDTEISQVSSDNINKGVDVNSGLDEKPLRFFTNKDRAKRFVERYNRRFATH